MAPTMADVETTPAIGSNPAGPGRTGARRVTAGPATALPGTAARTAAVTATAGRGGTRSDRYGQATGRGGADLSRKTQHVACPFHQIRSQPDTTGQVWSSSELDDNK